MNPNNPIGTHTGPWTFEQALTCAKAGGKVRRAHWPTPMYVAFKKWNSGAIELLAFSDRLSTDGGPAAIGPMAFGTSDMLADDWECVA